MLLAGVVTAKDYALDHYFPQHPEPWYAGVGGLGTDAQGNIYAGSVMGGIMKMTPTGHILGRFPLPVLTMEAPHLSASGVATDATGNMYGVSSMPYIGSYLYKMDSSGNPIWSFWGFGTNDYLYEPKDVAVDTAGNSYVADTKNCRVAKFDANGNFLAEFGGHRCPGPWDPESLLMHPYGLDVDGQGNVYVANSDKYQIVVFRPDGNVKVLFGEQGSSPGQLAYPYDVAVDGSGNIFVSDPGAYRIQKFSPAGQFIKTWGAKGHEDGHFEGPAKIAIRGNRLYAVDTLRIQTFDLEGNFLDSWTSGGTDNGKFWSPMRMAVANSGDIYVADTDNHRLQKFDKRGNFKAAVGSFGTGNGQFNSPRGIAVDDEGNIFVADTENNRFQKFNKKLEWVATINDAGGSPYWNKPIGVAADKNGYVYLLLEDGSLCKYDKNLQFIAVLETKPYGDPNGWPSGIDIGNTFFYYVVNTNRFIYKYDTEGNLITKYDGGRGGPGSFSGPDDIAISDTGKIFLSSGRNQVQVFNPDFTYLTEFGNSGPDPQRLWGFKSLAVANNGDVVVCESAANRVSIWSPQAGNPATVPAAARTLGAYGTVWRSDLTLFNPDAVAMSVEAAFFPASGEPISKILSLAPNEQVDYPDIIGGLFGMEGVYGQLQFTNASGPPPRVISRTYTGSTGATYGQGIPGLPLAGTFIGPEIVYFNGLTNTAAFHTNLGFVNLRASPLDLQLEFFDGLGNPLEERTVALGPEGMTQENFILAAQGEVEEAYARVRAVQEDARWAAYTSIVDHRTGDPAFVAGQKRDYLAPEEWRLLVPAAASTPGGYGTYWTSALVLTNTAEEVITVTAAFFPHDNPSASPQTAVMEVGAGESVRWEDAMYDLFGASGTFGYLTLSPDKNGLLALSRISTAGTGTGTYGQGIPAIPFPDLPTETVFLPGVEETMDFRSNLGLVNPTETGISVTVEAFRGGQIEATQTYELPPFSFQQIGSILTVMGFPLGITGVTLRLTPSEASPYYAHLSKADNRTGDPCFIPPSF